MAQLMLPSIDYMVILQILILAGSALALLLIDLVIPSQHKRVTALLALAATVGALLAGPASTQGVTLAGAIAFSPSTLIINSVILVATAISILFASDSLPKQGIERGEAYVLMLLASAGMLILVQAASLVILFMGLELLSIALYVLTAIAYPRVASEEAGLKYLIIGAFGAGFLVFGIALTFGATGSLLLGEIASRIPTSGVEQVYFLIGISLMVVGFGYKVSLVPFHMWTPDVYEGAPTAITAYMSVGSKVAGFVAIMALTQVVNGTDSVLQPILMGIAVLTMLVGSIVAMSQQSVKRMLAYSSIGHAGFIMLGVLTSGVTGGLMVPVFYMVAYTVTNLAAFGVVMAYERADGSDLQISDLSGLWQHSPWLTAIMTIALLSLAGVPPTVGFLAKFQILSATWSAGWVWLAVAAALASAISAYFYIRCLIQMYSGAPREAHTVLSTRSMIALAVVTVAIIVFGIMPWTVSAVALAS